MDEYTGKRTTGGLGFARRGSSLSYRDLNHEARNTQCCNRLGCSTRINSMKGIQVEYSEKAKSSKPALHSSSSKAVVGGSSKSFSGPYRKKSHQEQPYLKYSTETDLAASSSRHGSTEATEPISTTTDIQTVTAETEDKESSDTEDRESAIHGCSRSDSILEEVGNYAITRNLRAQKQVNQRSGLGSQDISLGSSSKDRGFRRSFATRTASQPAKPATQRPSASSHRYGLGNLSCTSISDVLPSACSSSDSGYNRRANVVKKRASDSCARGKSTAGPSSIMGISGSQRDAIPNRNISFTASPSCPQSTRRATNNWSGSRDAVASIRTRQTVIGNTRSRLSETGNTDVLSLPEPSMIPPLPQTDLSTKESTLASSSRSVPTDLPSNSVDSYGQSHSGNESVRSRAITRLEDSRTRTFHGSSADREGYLHFNMEGIAEVLLALDRIEQDEELSYEQLLILETNLFLGGLSFHDQHRDMRLDIDNMSYEELLALEEKMGCVSTALTEDALSNCLRRSWYKSDPLTSESAGCGDYDVKCSICQEEYVVGDEAGSLHCDHRYHMVCIQQWLRQKNWCPICKAPASLS